MNSTSESGMGANEKPADPELRHIVSVCRSAAARGGVGVLSTGEMLAAALVLNRADWLAEVGYTIVEALERVGPDWVVRLGAARRIMEDDERAAAIVAEGIEQAKVRPVLPAQAPEPVVLDYEATLVTYGHAPGYRDASITVDLRELDGTLDGHRFRASITFRHKGSEDVARHIIAVHNSAWSMLDGPLDREEGEQRPRWLPR